jgi:hypothetical protein
VIKLFNLNHIKAVLANLNLQEILLTRDDSISIDQYNTYDLQSLEIQEKIIENIDEILQAYAPFQLYFQSPVEHLPDDAWIYGLRGIYVVNNQDGSVVFSRKSDAIKYADEMSTVSWEIATREGLV